MVFILFALQLIKQFMSIFTFIKPFMNQSILFTKIESFDKTIDNASCSVPEITSLNYIVIPLMVTGVILAFFVLKKRKSYF